MSKSLSDKVESNTKRIDDLEDTVFNLWFTVNAARLVVTLALSIMIAINLGYL